MNEDKDIFEGISNESLELLSKVLDKDETNGIELFGALLAMPDKDFDILKPVFLDSIVDIYNTPQAQMQLVQALAQSGISINDILNNVDEVISSFTPELTELSETKVDMIKQMLSAAANAISTSTINPAHMVNIPVEICRENAKLPTYATNGSAAMDIYSPEEYTIECGQTIIIPIGIKVAIPHGYALLIQPRSGMSARMKVRIPNSPGLIDEDYHEEIGVIVENTDIRVKDVDIDYVTNSLGTGAEPTIVKEYGSPITIGKGERFAQMRLIEVPRVKWQAVKSLGEQSSDHGAGFGSTGVK